MGDPTKKRFIHRRVLLVDDHPAIHVAARAQLAEHTDYELLHALSGEEARALLRERRLDVLVLDHDLSTDCTGIDLMRWVRHSFRHEAPPAIVYTHRLRRDIWTLAERAGFMGYVSKQSPVSRLFEAIRHVYEGRTYQDAIGDSAAKERCMYSFAHCSLEASTGELRVGARPSFLGPKGLQLLVCLAEARLHDQPWVTFPVLREHLWGSSSPEYNENLKQLASQLRQMLEQPRLIGTRVGRFGHASAYCLTVPVEKRVSWRPSVGSSSGAGATEVDD